MNKVVVLCMMRLGSERLPGKLMNDLGGKPMAQWCLESLKAAAESQKADLRCAVPESDEPLIEIAKSLKVKTILRDAQSANGESTQDVYNETVLKPLQRQQMAVVVGGCMPFVSVKEYRKAIKIASTSSEEGSSAFYLRGFVWDEDRDLILGSRELNTKFSPGFYIPAHVYSIFDLRLMRKGTSFLHPRPIEVTRTITNMIHVDTEDDWKTAQAYWRGKYGPKPTATAA